MVCAVSEPVAAKQMIAVNTIPGFMDVVIVAQTVFSGNLMVNQGSHRKPQDNHAVSQLRQIAIEWEVPYLLRAQ